MALSAKLMMRQGQSLVMTPQLLQAIKLLQFSNVELAAFVDEELERNPILERADDAALPNERLTGIDVSDGPQSEPSSFNEPDEANWSSDEFATNRESLESSLGTELSNAFDDDRIKATSESVLGLEGSGLSATSWTGAGAGPGGGDSELSSLESYVAEHENLRDHLLGQLSLRVTDPRELLIGTAIVEAIDDNGYLSESAEDIAARLGTDEARVRTLLKTIQTFDPSGIGGRDLAECLAIQLRELDRFDPAMQALVANLPLLAKRDFVALRKICGVDEEDMADMVKEIRALDPKPGRVFAHEVLQPVVPDVLVRAAPDGSWLIELNTEVMPRVLVNQVYAARVTRGKASDADKSFVSNCLQTANWLAKSLEQRAKTILKVSSEIVRQQDGFLTLGVEHLRPLNLKTIADAIGMHESTISRVTSNKYMATPRGLFELKYFFTASIASSSGGEAHSAESVRHRIKQLIDAETVDDVLSDDAIVIKLKESKIDIARRTVAKYRESLRIPSSVERRREKAALLGNKS